LPTSFPSGVSRTWIAPWFWANRLQDWELRDGEAVCVRQDLPYRTLHLLSARSADSAGDLRASVEVSLPDGVANAFAGIWLGAGSPDLDPRANALVQMAGGREGGVAVGVDATGRASVRILDGRADGVAPPAPPGTLPRRGWRVVRVDSAEPDQPGSHVLDGDPSTIWHTEFRAKRPSHPHEIVIDMGAATEIAGLVYVPRHPEVPGRIDAYGIEVADSAYGPWRLVADGRFPNQPEPQQVRFEATTCRAFRLTAGSAHLDRPSTTVAELYALAPGAAQLPTRTTPPARVRIDVVAAPDGVGTSRVELTVRDAADGTTVDVTAQDGVPDRLLAGSIAVCCDTGGRAEKGATFRFASLRVEGSRVEELPDNRFGPIGGTQYTRSRGVVKLTAQMLPIGDDEPREVALQLDRGQGFETVATAPILQPGYTATFRVDGLGAADTIPYRVCYPKDAPSPEGTFAGTIQAEPAPTAP
ncbi:MAG: discoidin domain-containing protein, partial [Planctomycetota bacterium]